MKYTITMPDDASSARLLCEIDEKRVQELQIVFVSGIDQETALSVVRAVASTLDARRAALQ